MKIKLLVIALALVPALSLAACGGTETPSDSNTSPAVTSESDTQLDTPDSSTAATPPLSSTTGVETDEQSQKANSTADPILQLEDGTFWRAMVAADDEYPARIASNVWGFRLYFKGDTLLAPPPEISDLTIFIDGVAQSVSIVYSPAPNITNYEFDDSTMTVTNYNFVIDKEFTQKPANYYFEMILNGVAIRSRSSDWQTDGFFQQLDDAPDYGASINILAPETSTEPDDGTYPGIEDANIPGGPTFDLPAPFETHSGDAQYFYGEGEDYFVAMYDAKGNSYDSEEFADNATVTCYVGYIFENGEAVSFFRKYIFETSDEAEAYVAGHGAYIAVDNVAYLENSKEVMLDTIDKTAIVDRWTLEANEYSGQTYSSMP